MWADEAPLCNSPTFSPTNMRWWSFTLNVTIQHIKMRLDGSAYWARIYCLVIKCCWLQFHLFCMSVKRGRSHRGRNVGSGYLGLRGMRQQGSGEDCIMRSLTICAPHQILFGCSNQEWYGRDMQRVWETWKVHTLFWWGNLKEGNHLEDLWPNGRIIFTRIFSRWEGEAWTGLIWLRIRDRWRTVVSAVMNLLVPENARNFWTSWEPVSFSRRTLLHGVRSPSVKSDCTYRLQNPYGHKNTQPVMRS